MTMRSTKVSEFIFKTLDLEKVLHNKEYWDYNNSFIKDFIKTCTNVNTFFKDGSTPLEFVLNYGSPDDVVISCIAKRCRSQS